MSGADARARLRSYPIFQALSDEQLAWLVPRTEEVEVGGGTILFREGDPPEHFWVLVEGELEIQKLIGGANRVVATNSTPGVWAGSVPLVDTVHQITARAPRASRLFRFRQDDMAAMLANGFPIATHLLLGVRAGTERFQSELYQQEKLTALGKLSAGLAHELNNPASAAQRATSELARALDAHRSAALGLSVHGLERCRDELDHLQRALAARARSAPMLAPVAKGDREDELVAWLDRHGVPDAWEAASALADLDVDGAWLEELTGRVPKPALPAVLRWALTGVTAAGLLEEIEHATRRIVELVAAVKAYSYMDQAPLQEVDVHEGIETTLTILRHKLRDGIEVERDYATDLPRLSVHGSGLNQVWTNLLDNAIDALGGTGRIRIRTFRLGDDVAVEITDDGPGIPPELQSRVFEPFFTTKAPGEGTGLGLDLVYRTVVRDHNGHVYVSSEPGATTFRVRLPVRP
ncbi:MAG: ATP-binding protein [Actinomycetota bacterium]|nr:ATP-binding protein [Actinomycetota bacterium]